MLDAVAYGGTKCWMQTGKLNNEQMKNDEHWIAWCSEGVISWRRSEIECSVL